MEGVFQVLYEREVYGLESPKPQFARPYLGARDLAGLEAGGADVHLAAMTVDDDVDTLDVRTELAVGDAVRVADGTAGDGVLTADFANFGHNDPPWATIDSCRVNKRNGTIAQT